MISCANGKDVNFLSKAFVNSKLFKLNCDGLTTASKSFTYTGSTFEVRTHVFP